MNSLAELQSEIFRLIVRYAQGDTSVRPRAKKLIKEFNLQMKELKKGKR